MCIAVQEEESRFTEGIQNLAETLENTWKVSFAKHIIANISSEREIFLSLHISANEFSSFPS